MGATKIVVSAGRVVGTHTDTHACILNGGWDFPTNREGRYGGEVASGEVGWRGWSRG